MGRKAITILITVTVVVALFSFGSLVALRPDAEEGFMSALFPKSEPLVADVEPIPTPDEILSDILSSDELRETVRKEVAEKMNEIALEGADIDVDVLRETILKEVSEALLESQMQAMEALEAEAEELRTENAALKAGLDDLVSRLDALEERQAATEDTLGSLEENLRAETASLIDTRIEELKTLFASADRAVYDSVMDELTLLEDDIYAYIDSELERQIAELSIMPIDGEGAAIDENRLVEIFAENILAASRSNTGDTVYDEIVYNVSADVMAMLAQEDAKAYGELTEYRDASYDVIEMVVNEVLDRLAGETYTVEPAPAEEIVEEPAVEEVIEEPVVEEPVTEEPAPAEEPAAEPVVEEPATEPEPVVEEPAAPRNPLLTRPGFTFEESKVAEPPTRSEARDAAIEGILNALRQSQGK